MVFGSNSFYLYFISNLQVYYKKEQKNSNYNNEYIFIEVKTRTTKSYGNPAEAINKNKIKHIINTSKYYLLKNKLKNFFIRYDVIEIYLKGNKVFINHIRNVFY